MEQGVVSWSVELKEVRAVNYFILKVWQFEPRDGSCAKTWFPEVTKVIELFHITEKIRITRQLAPKPTRYSFK